MGLRDRLQTTSTPLILIEPGPPSESLAGLIGFPVANVVDEAGAVRDAFQAHATPHVFLIRDSRIRDQQLGADVPRVLSMVADDLVAAPSAVSVS